MQRNDIIVFPEYGLFGIFGYVKYARRSDIYPFLETIPNPEKVSWNPCMERKSSYPSTEIQRELSCMAKDYDIYVVANVGEKVACKKQHDHGCPSDGRYQYNTNVVYSSNGTLIAKYRKKNLYKENYYDSPYKTEVVTFNTHFGKFGLLTSHDSLFKSPIIDLVYGKQVRDIVMPNAWMTSKPLFRAVQWHSSFARGLEINLLVSTVYDDHCNSYGSGIYGRDGSKGYVSEEKGIGYYDPDEGALISEGVRTLSYLKPRKKNPIIPKWSISRTKTFNHSVSFLYQNVSFKFIELKRSFDDINICHGRFCCRLNYSSNDPRIEKYAVGVYKGPVRTLGYLLEVEVCVVVRCYPQCGQPIQRANTYFDRFNLVGVNFSTPFIYPQVLTLNGRKAELATHQWDYKHGQIIFEREPENPLHSASLIGRVYDRDKKDHRRPYRNESNFLGYAPARSAANFLLIVAFIASIIFSS